MRPIRAFLPFAAVALLAACVPPPPIPAEALAPQTDANGDVHFAGSGQVSCDRVPIALDGFHTSVSVVGACHLLIVTGTHNDVSVAMAPGGILVVSGDHNDIRWHAIGRGRPPDLHDVGDDNSWHNDDG